MGRAPTREGGFSVHGANGDESGDFDASALPR
jgi:hypothetical protein